MFGDGLNCADYLGIYTRANIQSRLMVLKQKRAKFCRSGEAGAYIAVARVQETVPGDCRDGPEG